ncbi:MAG: hypothetical protein M3O91_09700 [Chloroflexota bacterium]|nr:hypothetical protein [Chloroflexota bacterium]
MSIVLDGAGAWPDLIAKRERGEVIHLTEGARLEVAALAGGMTSGKPSVAIRVDLPDGRVVVAETSMRLFLAAAVAFHARYGSDLEGQDVAMR